MRRNDKYVEHLREVPMFSACSNRELNLLGRLVEHMDVAAGTELVHEGQTGREFYIIIKGEAAVIRGGREVNRLGPGDSFGELALLDVAPRNATVTAITDLEVALLGNREFAGALADIPALARKVMVGMARRLHQLDARDTTGTNEYAAV